MFGRPGQSEEAELVLESLELVDVDDSDLAPSDDAVVELLLDVPPPRLSVL